MVVPSPTAIVERIAPPGGTARIARPALGQVAHAVVAARPSQRAQVADIRKLGVSPGRVGGADPPHCRYRHNALAG